MLFLTNQFILATLRLYLLIVMTQVGTFSVQTPVDTIISPVVKVNYTPSPAV